MTTTVPIAVEIPEETYEKLMRLDSLAAQSDVEAKSLLNAHEAPQEIQEMIARLLNLLVKMQGQSVRILVEDGNEEEIAQVNDSLQSATRLLAGLSSKVDETNEGGSDVADSFQRGWRQAVDGNDLRPARDMLARLRQRREGRGE